MTKKEYAERHHYRKRFWTYLLDRAKSKTKLHANISPNIYSWVGTSAGIGGVGYNYVIGQHDAKVELYIDKDKEDGKENKELFDRLQKNKDKIEASFGSNLSWERLDNKRASRIAKHFNDIGYKDENKWEELADAMIDNMIKLEKALSPFLK